MIITSCPLRISLVGGSTDNPKFIEKYGSGSVISFASNLRTYTTIHRDVFGANTIDHNYIINYSKMESVKTISEIKNELIRDCFEYLNVDKINCSLTSDVFSSGSGLASSSAYLLSLVKAIYVLKKIHITEYEVCKIAEKIEKGFNPLVGQQDFYGSLGGLKKIKFYKNEDPSIRFLSTQIFENFDIYLIYTGILRNSTAILETLDVEKSLVLLDDVEDLEKAINNLDVTSFNDIISRSWNNKKRTSPFICQNPILSNIDNIINDDNRILSHKLCGAGNGGYFLIFTNKGENYKSLKDDYGEIEQIYISDSGIKSINLKDEFK